MHVWRYRRSQSTPIDISDPSALYQAARARAVERGELWHKLQEAQGTSAAAVTSGSVEIRGADRSIILVIYMDEKPFHRTCDHWHITNYVGLDIDRTRLEGTDATVWAIGTLETLCGRLLPDYGHVCRSDEYDQKNMRHEGVVEAIGVDDSRYLPGVYWANFLGEVYCGFMGRDKLLSAPAYEVRGVGSGILVRMSEKPQEWHNPGYKEREQRFLDHVGREYFFERDNPDKPTKSPWNLPKLPPLQPGAPAKDIQVLHSSGGKYEVLNPEIREALGQGPLEGNVLKRLGLPPDWKPPKREQS